MAVLQRGLGSPTPMKTMQMQPPVPAGPTPQQTRFDQQSLAGQNKMMSPLGGAQQKMGQIANGLQSQMQRSQAQQQRPVAPLPAVKRPTATGAKPPAPQMARKPQPKAPAVKQSQALAKPAAPRAAQQSMMQGQAGLNRGMPAMPTAGKAPFLNPTPFKAPGAR
jgi:hypothetical protein